MSQFHAKAQSTPKAAKEKQLPLFASLRLCDSVRTVLIFLTPSYAIRYMTPPASRADMTSPPSFFGVRGLRRHLNQPIIDLPHALPGFLQG